MAQLANVLASTEAVNDESFLVYKDRVIRYLSGFASEFRRCAQRVEDQILRVEELGVEPMLALAASVDEPPVFGKTAEEVAELRRAEKRDAWRALSAWFVSAGLEAAPWRKLTATLGAAIDWVVASATRLDARRAQRIDRSAEYRHLAALALRADVGRVPPRLRRRLRARRAPPLLRHRRRSAEGGAAADRAGRRARPLRSRRRSTVPAAAPAAPAGRRG